MAASRLATAPQPNLQSRGARGDHRAEIGVLKRLWNEQCEAAATGAVSGANMEYLAAHFATDMPIARHLAVIDQIAPYIQGRVLEWGCQHALDSCVYRMRFGDSVELYGCDANAPGAYPPFHEFSGIQYTPLRHHYLLDFEDEFFDVATSNGVLEHVPDDASSLRELYRVLKPGGTLLIACLPNRYSYTEALQRTLKNPAHDRLYTIRSTRAMLATAGFDVLRWDYVFMLPTMLNGFPPRLKSTYERAGRLVWAANAVLERIWPINRLASNLTIVARKPSLR